MDQTRCPMLLLPIVRLHLKKKQKKRWSKMTQMTYFRVPGPLKTKNKRGPGAEARLALFVRVLLWLAHCAYCHSGWSIFLTVVGSKTYSLLRSLVAPSLPQEKTFAELSEVLKVHFEPKPLVIAERFALKLWESQ